MVNLGPLRPPAALVRFAANNAANGLVRVPDLDGRILPARRFVAGDCATARADRLEQLLVRNSGCLGALRGIAGRAEASGLHRPFSCRWPSQRRPLSHAFIAARWVGAGGWLSSA